MRPTTAACLLLALAAPLPAQQITALDAGPRSQLMADPSVVLASRGVAFTAHPAAKHPANPLVRPDRPWEGRYVTAFGGAVLFDPAEKLFKMWYTADGAGGVLYATSRDGLAWDKPDLGPGPARNLVAPRLGCPAVMLDPADPDPARRFKMVAFDRDRGYLALTSPDGLAWSEQSPRAFLPISYVDDVVSAFRDARTGEFVTLGKMSTPVFGRVRRTTYASRSHDFRHWGPLVPAFVADRLDDLGTLARIERVRPLLTLPTNPNVARTEFYGGGAYAAESCVIGFPWAFSVSANLKAGTGNQEGPIETQFAVSRDLEAWHRPSRTPAIPPGEPGTWEGGMTLTASYAIDAGDEVRLYYGGSPNAHNRLSERPAEGAAGAIGLATWRRDRFVSADAGREGGEVTTVPLTFAGSRLEVNAAVKAGGEVRVEVTDPAGRPLEGFGPSEPLAGDGLRLAAAFPGWPDLAKLAGRPVCLRFRLRDASLYAFAFRP